MIYGIVFTLAVLFAHYARKLQDRQAKIMFILSGASLVLLGAFRAETVGTDVLVYMKRYFIAAQDVQNIFQYLGNNNGEPIYLILTFLTSKVFHNIQVLFFFNELIIVGFVYMAIWKQKEKVYIEIAILFFVLVFYGQTLNTTRQSIAMAIILYAFSEFLNGNCKRYIIFCFIAIGFHYSAIIAVTIPLLYLYSKREIAKKGKVIFAVFALVLIGFYEHIFTVCVKLIPFLPKRYLDDVYLHREFNIPLCEVGLWGIMFIIAVLYAARKKEDSEFWYYVHILPLTGTMIAAQATFASRIFWYFEYLVLIFYSRKDILPIKKNRLNQLFFYGLVTSIMLAYFIYLNVCINSAGIMPYTFFRAI